jgi:hypothetical protein
VGVFILGTAENVMNLLNIAPSTNIWCVAPSF